VSVKRQECRPLLTTRRKSQLAIEYSYQIRTKSPATWVFWVHASNEARFEQSFRDIADQVKIYGRQDPKVNIFKLVENRLRDEKLGKWVCILDNVDEDKFLCSLPTAGKGDPTIGPANGLTKKPLLEYVPRSQNGSIIITSRSREVALKMVDYEDLIKVEPMEKSESLELLQRKLKHPEGESQECLQLVDALEFMPLAIVQAASYIRNREPRYSVSQYLADFEGSDRKATSLLEKEAGRLSRDWEAKNSILVTWQISFDYLRQENSSAAELLSLMSFFDRQGIPENLIRLRPRAKCISSSDLFDDWSDGEISESEEDPEFEDDITTLRNYSFISICENSTSFTMHRLVQLTTRAWLKSDGQIDKWKDKFISILCDEFPTGEYENWGRCRLLFPHVKSATSQRPESQNQLLKWATLLHKGSWFASESGIYGDIRQMASKSEKYRMRLLGAEDEETLQSTEILAKSYWLEGRWTEAVQLNEQVMETRKTKFAEDHPRLLTSLANLASLYRDQGQWEKSERLFTKVIEIRKTRLGDDHLSTLSSMVNLASTYRHQGRFESAEQLQTQVMEAFKTKLGDDHPFTLWSITNLASTYRRQGRWAEAEQFEEQVMKASKTKLGDDHPVALSSMGNLAVVYWNRGRREEAEQLQTQAMEAFKTKLGDDHPSTLTSMANLASIYRDQGQWEKSERLFTKVIEIRKTRLGDDHPSTLTSMGNMASTYWNQGRFEEAGQLQAQVMETCKRKLGDNHPNTLTTMANLAVTWKSSGHDAKAIDLLRHCLTKQKECLGLNHPHTLSSSRTLLVWETSKLNIHL